MFVLPVAAEDRLLGALQIAWADAALCAKLIFYHRLVLYTSVIKPSVHSCLKKVRRGAWGIISLCMSHIMEWA